MMVAFIGLAALAIDVGSFYQAQRQAQGAADAAALAGVNYLPTSQGLATTAANNYVAQNYPGAPTPVVTYPSSTQIKVVVSNSTPSFFGRVFGITSANVGAMAIAGQPVGLVGALQG
jgi:Flp pilus assembly protein TadG